VVPLVLAAVLLAQGGGAAPCDALCERKAAFRLIETGTPDAVIRHLRAARARFPDDRVLTLLLARAYLRENNLFWAERTVGNALARRPDDDELRAWLAGIHLRQGDPRLAREDLGAEAAPAATADHARWNLEQAFTAQLLGDDATARSALAGVPRSSVLFPEDRPLWRLLQRRLDGWWIDPLSGWLEVGGGRTSNAFAGAPTDPGRSGGPSGLAELDLRMRVAPPVPATVRPVADLEIEGELLSAEEARELSNLRAAVRLGGLLTGTRHRLLAAYRHEVLWLDQAGAQYSTAHRGELELEVLGGWVVAAGGGRRTYRDERRSRWDGDVSVGVPIRLHGSASLAAGATVHVADARSNAWDERGAAMVATLRFGLGRGFSSRITTMAALDDYPHSGGTEGLLVFGTSQRRRDVLGRVALEAAGPRWRGVTPILEWRLTRRDSTADRLPGFDFAYRESRVTLKLHYRFAADPWAPRVVHPKDHVAFDWGVEGGEEGERDRILDLLRQDEELRRGSSCSVR
jgi:hypothetical protein